MITIDNREHKLIEIFNNNNIKYNKENLDFGDILIVNNNINILIERKTISDLASSIKDGRYKEQKLRLKDYSNKYKIIYLIEGDIYLDKIYNGITSKTIQGIVLKLILRDNINCINCNSINDSFKLINNIVDLINKNKLEEDSNFSNLNNISINDINYSNTFKKCKKDNLTPLICNINQLSQIPSVSTRISSSIIDKYLSIENLINEYNKIELLDDKYNMLSDLKINNRKIGKKLSKKIYNYLSNK